MVSRRTVIATPLALLASSVPSMAYASKNQEIKIGVSLSPDSLDPTSSSPVVIGEITYNNIFQGLTAIDENGNVTAMLASSWSISNDNLNYIFNIKDNVYYSDDKQLDAHTVEFSLNRAISLKNKNKLYNSLFKNIKNIVVLDKFKIEVQLHAPNPLTLFRLAEPPAVILHPSSSNQASTNPIGTGPYKLEKWDKKGNKIQLIKWNKHSQANNIKINRATFYFMPGSEDRIKAIKNGSIDILFHMTAVNIKEFRFNNEYEILSGTSSSKCLIAINNKRAPLNDINVRRALAHAIDREKIIQEAFLGRGKAIGSHYAPSEPGYINLTSRYEFNIEKSKQLLKQSDIDPSTVLNLDLPPTPYAIAADKIIVKSMENIGLEIKVNHLSWEQWMQKVFTGDFDLSFILHAEPLDFDIYTNPDYYFGYDSPRFREIYNKYLNDPNLRVRNKMLHEIQHKLSEDCVNIWVVSPEIATLTKKGVKGVWVNYPIFAHNLADMYWHK